MKRKWQALLPKMIEGKEKLVCPNCGRDSIQHLYVGDGHTRVGYLQIWCETCRKGIVVSRVVAPAKASFLSFEDATEQDLPVFEIL